MAAGGDESLVALYDDAGQRYFNTAKGLQVRRKIISLAKGSVPWSTARIDISSLVGPRDIKARNVTKGLTLDYLQHLHGVGLQEGAGGDWRNKPGLWKKFGRWIKDRFGAFDKLPPETEFEVAALPPSAPESEEEAQRRAQIEAAQPRFRSLVAPKRRGDATPQDLERLDAQRRQCETEKRELRDNLDLVDAQRQECEDEKQVLNVKNVSLQEQNEEVTRDLQQALIQERITENLLEAQETRNKVVVDELNKCREGRELSLDQTLAILEIFGFDISRSDLETQYPDEITADLKQILREGIDLMELREKLELEARGKRDEAGELPPPLPDLVRNTLTFDDGGVPTNLPPPPLDDLHPESIVGRANAAMEDLRDNMDTLADISDGLETTPEQDKKLNDALKVGPGALTVDDVKDPEVRALGEEAVANEKDPDETADSRLLRDIRGVDLRPAPEAPQKEVSLMESVRKGLKLRPVGERQVAEDVGSTSGEDLTSVLARGFDRRFGSLKRREEENGNGNGDGDDWDTVSDWPTKEQAETLQDMFTGSPDEVTGDTQDSMDGKKAPPPIPPRSRKREPADVGPGGEGTSTETSITSTSTATTEEGVSSNSGQRGRGGRGYGGRRGGGGGRYWRGGGGGGGRRGFRGGYRGRRGYGYGGFLPGLLLGGALGYGFGGPWGYGYGPYYGYGGGGYGGGGQPVQQTVNVYGDDDDDDDKNDYDSEEEVAFYGASCHAPTTAPSLGVARRTYDDDDDDGSGEATDDDDIFWPASCHSTATSASAPRAARTRRRGRRRGSRRTAAVLASDAEGLGGTVGSRTWSTGGQSLGSIRGSGAGALGRRRKRVQRSTIDTTTAVSGTNGLDGLARQGKRIVRTDLERNDGATATKATHYAREDVAHRRGAGGASSRKSRVTISRLGSRGAGPAPRLPPSVVDGSADEPPGLVSLNDIDGGDEFLEPSEGRFLSTIGKGIRKVFTKRGYSESKLQQLVASEEAFDLGYWFTHGLKGAVTVLVAIGYAQAEALVKKGERRANLEEGKGGNKLIISEREIEEAIEAAEQGSSPPLGGRTLQELTGISRLSDAYVATAFAMEALCKVAKDMSGSAYNSHVGAFKQSADPTIAIFELLQPESSVDDLGSSRQPSWYTIASAIVGASYGPGTARAPTILRTVVDWIRGILENGGAVTYNEQGDVRTVSTSGLFLDNRGDAAITKFLQLVCYLRFSTSLFKGPDWNIPKGDSYKAMRNFA